MTRDERARLEALAERWLDRATAHFAAARHGDTCFALLAAGNTRRNAAEELQRLLAEMETAP